MNQKGISFKRVLIFLLIAIPISNIFRFDLFGTKELLVKLPIWVNLPTQVILEGIGVFLGALTAIYLLKKERKLEISFLGTSKSKGLFMSVIPIILLAVFGVKNDYGVNKHTFGLIAVFGTMFYCIMEEYGWRGYLQEEFKNLKPIKRYLLIGFIWYFWHLTFLTQASLFENVFFLVMLIFGSWGIGQVAESTKSILASACFHLIIQIMMFNTIIKDGIDGTQKIMILGISVFVWFVILRKWNSNQKATPKDNKP